MTNAQKDALLAWIDRYNRLDRKATDLIGWIALKYSCSRPQAERMLAEAQASTPPADDRNPAHYLRLAADAISRAMDNADEAATESGAARYTLQQIQKAAGWLADAASQLKAKPEAR